ncbi:helix-turn-helix domain-containing protein [Microbacterium oxydans]|uniref:helix-turn-helix domain-containing protein n=1 Tax=Microbacterium oxydans TaxID=82380 RepID=UPI0036317102
MNYDKLIGSRIKRAREAAGLSQNGLSEALKARGLSLPGQTIYKIEQGTRKVLAAELPIFGDSLGVPAANLLGLTNDRSPLLSAGGRLTEAMDNLRSSALSYGRAMLSFAQAADRIEEPHPDDESWASGPLLRQTPGWIATAHVLDSIEATRTLNRIGPEVTGRHAQAVLDALRAEQEHFHGAADG